MSKEIVNRVANSELVTIDLENHYPEGERVVIDIKKWLYLDQILKEKDFRESLAKYSWKDYQDKYVSLICSTEAIIPSWAYLLITVYLSPFARRVVVGNLEQLELSIFQDVIDNLSIDMYRDKPVIIKGCSEKNIPNSAYTLLIAKLFPVVRSLMYGEACSNVPLYKRNN